MGVASLRFLGDAIFVINLVIKIVEKEAMSLRERKGGRYT